MSLAGLTDLVKDMPDAERKALMLKWSAEYKRDTAGMAELGWLAILASLAAMIVLWAYL